MVGTDRRTAPISSTCPDQPRMRDGPAPDGWLLACPYPARKGDQERTALRRLLTHCPPNTSRRRAQVEASTAMAHHAALGPRRDARSRTLQDAVDARLYRISACRIVSSPGRSRLAHLVPGSAGQILAESAEASTDSTTGTGTAIWKFTWYLARRHSLVPISSVTCPDQRTRMTRGWPRARRMISFGQHCCVASITRPETPDSASADQGEAPVP